MSFVFQQHKDLKRFFLSAFYHLNEPHLVYNMMSLLWKGIKLETSMGSTQFASMVVTLLGMSQGVTLLLAKSLHVFFDYRRAYFHEYSVGFSGVLFALKVVLNAQAEDYSSVYGVLVPTKYAAWAELVLVQMFVPRASFLGHLGGILAGILYMKMKRSYSGSDPVAMVVRGVARAVTWPLRLPPSSLTPIFCRKNLRVPDPACGMYGVTAVAPDVPAATQAPASTAVQVPE